MKQYKSIIVAAVAVAVVSCADEKMQAFQTADPNSEHTAQYAYLNDYADLKSYVNPNASPTFKLGGAMAATDFNKKEQHYALEVANFNEIVAGNEMKMASCINSNGISDFSTVTTFVNNAVDAGLSVYGHTLAWHSQQPVKWLNKLIADKEIDLPDGVLEKFLHRITYTDGPFPFYPMGCEPPVVNGAIHFVPTGGWSQFFICDGGSNTLSPGNFRLKLDITSNKEANGVQVELRNGWAGEGKPDPQVFSFAVPIEAGRKVYEFDMQDVTCEPGANYDVILKPQTADATLDVHSVQVCKLIKANAIPLTPEEKKDTLTWAMDKWISGMMEACEGKVKAWDVVNEAISGADLDGDGIYDLQHDPEGAKSDDFYWQDYLGDLDYVRSAVAMARLYGPEDIKLFINDYNLESDWDNNQKLKSLIVWIKRWEDDGVTKIDGIGTQMHISCYEDQTVQANKKAAIENMLKLMVESGKLVRISELDMGYVDANNKKLNTADLTEEQHKQMAELYNWIIQTYFEIVPVAQQWGICQWCITDSPSNSGWRPNEPVGLWDQNFYRKHVYGGFATGLAGKPYEPGK